MEFYLVVVLLLIWNSANASANLDERTNITQNQFERSNQQRRFQKNPCIVFTSDVEHRDNSDSVHETFQCELQGDDRGGKNYAWVIIRGLPSPWTDREKIKSGVTTFFAQNAVIDDSTYELLLPERAVIKLSSILRRSSWTRNSNVPYVQRVLVLRVEAQDMSTTATEAEISDDIFGTDGDQMTFKSQYNLCSDGKLQFDPATSNNMIGSDGVLTVNLPNLRVSDFHHRTLAGIAVNQASLDLNAPQLVPNVADHIVVCLPPGTKSETWYAEAFVNSWRSHFNDNLCRYPSILMHEIGHNLNLHHSGKGDDIYGDMSGLMGYSYASDDNSRMCFNGPKTWQLGWYSNYHLNLSAKTNIDTTVDLIGFAEKSYALKSDIMIVRIQSTVSSDVYLHFNRRIGFNINTMMGGDQVLVATQNPVPSYSASDLKSQLDASGVYLLSNFDGSSNALQISVISITTNAVPARARVRIQFLAGSQIEALPTPIPTHAPTRMPSPFPTRNPTSEPTEFPTLNPSQIPSTVSPTLIPSVFPSQFPTPLPSAFPSTSPTWNPTTFPSNAPTAVPSVSPSSNPTIKPIFLPKSPPSLVNTGHLTSSPARLPSKKPSRLSRPSRKPSRKMPTSAPTQKRTKVPTLGSISKKTIPLSKLRVRS